MQQPNRYNCAAVMKKLREIDFCLVETVLYLDAYPDHPQALAYYHKLVEERAALMEQYEKSCGPLSIYGNKSRQSWDWVKAPWPWESDAD
jgi:spore coat protein JB